MSCTFPGPYCCFGALMEYFCMIYSFKKLLIYRILALYTAPQFSLCPKQAVLAFISLRPPPAPEATSANHETNYSSRISLLFLVLYSKCQCLKDIRTCLS